LLAKPIKLVFIAFAMDILLQNQFNEVIERLTRIERLCFASVPVSRRTKKVMFSEPTDQKKLNSNRDEDFMRTFTRLAHADRSTKNRSGFNRAIQQEKDAPPWEIVPISVLRNRLTQRKAFAPDVDSGEKSVEAVVNAWVTRMVRKGDVVLAKINEVDARIACNSTTEVLLTPNEWVITQRMKGHSGKLPEVRATAVEETDDEADSRRELERRIAADNAEKDRIEAAEKALAIRLRREQDERADIEGMATLDEGDDEPSSIPFEFDMRPIGEAPEEEAEEVKPSKKKKAVEEPLVVKEFGSSEPTDEELESQFGETSTWSLKR
jgi:hypothetical protein